MTSYAERQHDVQEQRNIVLRDFLAGRFRLFSERGQGEEVSLNDAMKSREAELAVRFDAGTEARVVVEALRRDRKPHGIYGILGAGTNV